MRAHILALLAAAPAQAAVAQLARTPFCQFVTPAVDNIEENHAHIAEAKVSDSYNATLEEEYHIDVYFHVVAKSTRVQDGYVKREKITEVVDILNTAYASTPFRWTLKDIDWTVNTKWEPDYNNVKDYDMKKTLRKGDYRTLNVYIMKDWSGGYAVLPQKVTRGDRNFIEDGVVLGPDALNGSDHPVYNQGKVLAHEAGHWNGLLHPFQGGCTSPGDYVDDTPYEDMVSFDINKLCPAGRDSCPDLPGLDPIHNYMDYTSDACKTEFTPGQIARMVAHWKTFRQNWK